MRRTTRALIAVLAAAAIAGCSGDSVDPVTQAKQLLSEGKGREATIELKRALQEEPGNRAARRMLGEIYLLDGNGPLAEREFSELLTSEGSEIDLLIGRARYLQRRFDDLLQDLSPERFPDPKLKIEVRKLRAEAQIAKRDLTAAKAEYQALLDAEPDSADGLVGLGRLALAEGRVDTALGHADRLLAVDPDHILARSLRSLALHRMGRVDEARASYEELLRRLGPDDRGPQWLQANLALIEIELAAREVTEAKGRVQALLEVFPSYPRIIYFKALIAFIEGDLEAAESDLKGLVDRVPELDRAQLLLGSVSLAQKRYGQAVDALEQALRAAPDSSEARRLLATAQIENNQPAEALAMIKPLVERQPADATVLRIAAQAALRTGDTALARDYLQRAVKANPDDERLRADLARVLLAAGEQKDAVNALEQLVGDGEDQTNLLIYAYLRAGEIDKARARAREQLAAQPESVQALLVNAAVELTAEQNKPARSYLEQALALQPDNPGALLNLARIDVLEDAPARARERLEAILKTDPKYVSAMLMLSELADREGRFSDAREWLEKARDAVPESLAPHLLLGRRHLEAGRYEAAIAELQAARQIAPEAETLRPPLADAYLLAGQGREALTLLEEWVEEAPDQALVQYSLALAQMRLKQDDYALLSLKKTLEKDPQMVAARGSRIEVLSRSGKTAEALAEAEALVREQPRSDLGYRHLGQLLLDSGERAKAGEVFARGLRETRSGRLAQYVGEAYRDAGDAEAGLRLLAQWRQTLPDDDGAAMILGMAHHAAGDLEQAERLLGGLARKLPDNAALLNNLAVLELEMGRHERALERARKAHALAPGNAAILDTLGWILLTTGELEEGERLIAQARERSREPSILYHHAVALNRLGDKQRARETLAQALDGEQRFPERAAAQELQKTL